MPFLSLFYLIHVVAMFLRLCSYYFLPMHVVTRVLTLLFLQCTCCVEMLFLSLLSYVSYHFAFAILAYLPYSCQLCGFLCSYETLGITLTHTCTHHIYTMFLTSIVLIYVPFYTCYISFYVLVICSVFCVVVITDCVLTYVLLLFVIKHIIYVYVCMYTYIYIYIHIYIYIYIGMCVYASLPKSNNNTNTAWRQSTRASNTTIARTSHACMQRNNQPTPCTHTPTAHRLPDITFFYLQPLRCVPHCCCDNMPRDEYCTKATPSEQF
jgi:hypothetical protein